MFDDLPVPHGGRSSSDLDQVAAAAGMNRGAGFADRPAAPNQGAQITRLISAVRRYKWLLLTFAVGGAGAGFLARRFVAPTYTAEATIWIQASNSRESQSSGPIRSVNLLEVNGWVDLLRSFAVLDNVAVEQRLYLGGNFDNETRMAFNLAERFRPGGYQLTTDEKGKRYELRDVNGVLIESGAVGDSIGRKLGFLWAPKLGADKTYAFSVTTPREAARGLNANLQTTMRTTQRQEQNFIRLSLQGGNPARTVEIVNAVADRFVEVGAELKRSQLSELVSILETQRMYAEKNLRDAEIALEGFRVQTVTLPQDNATPVTPGLERTMDPVMSNYFEMKIQREQLRRDAQTLESALATPNGVTDALAALPRTSQSPELMAALDSLTAKRSQLRALQQQYTPEHPVMQRLVQDLQRDEQQTIPRLGNALLGQMATRANILDGWINSASVDLQKIPPRMIEEARLRRDVEIAERLHSNLRERFEEARLATVTTIPDVKLLDRAAPADSPVGIGGMQFIAIGFIAGIALGIMVAILLDRFDPRFRYPDQVTNQLGLPIIGALPHVKTGRNGAGNTTTQALEALREIRLNLAHSLAGQHPLVLAITSPGSGDGKTFISCNLALACANAGQRTLIIDGDTRRGELHRLLGASRSPGLTDYLRGEVPMSVAMQTTEHGGLTFIGCGTRREAAPNLLGNAAMQELLSTARQHYDVVLIDCPPLAAGVDPYLLGTMTGNVMLVLRTGRTDRALTEAKLQVLDRLPVQLAGAVLNGVQPTGVYRYYSYLSGYEPPPDETPDPNRELQGV